MEVVVRGGGTTSMTEPTRYISSILSTLLYYRLGKLLGIIQAANGGLGIRKAAAKQIGLLLSQSDTPDPIVSVLQQVHDIQVYFYS